MEKTRDKYFWDCTVENDFDMPSAEDAAFLCLNHYEGLVRARVGTNGAVEEGAVEIGDQIAQT